MTKAPEEWVEHVSMPAMHLVFPLLTALAGSHAETARLVADSGILPVVHLLEDLAVAEAEIGSMAEVRVRLVGWWGWWGWWGWLVGLVGWWG